MHTRRYMICIKYQMLGTLCGFTAVGISLLLLYYNPGTGNWYIIQLLRRVLRLLIAV